MAVIFFFLSCAPSPTLHFQKEGLCYNEPTHFTTDVSIKEIKEGGVVLLEVTPSRICGFLLVVCTSVLSLACGVPGRSAWSDWSAPGRDVGSGSSPPVAALWREKNKRWGCHCTKRKTPWLTSPPPPPSFRTQRGSSRCYLPLPSVGHCIHAHRHLCEQMEAVSAHSAPQRAVWISPSSGHLASGELASQSRGRCRKPVSVGPQRGHPPPGNLGDLEGRGRACWETCPRPCGFAGGAPA